MSEPEARGRKTMTLRRSSSASTLALAGCFDTPCEEENPAQKAFLDGLQRARQARARLQQPAAGRGSGQAERGAGRQGRRLLRLVRHAAPRSRATPRRSPSRSISAAKFRSTRSTTGPWPWRARWPTSSPHDRASRRRRAFPMPAIAALKTLRLGERVLLSGRMGEIAGSGVFDSPACSARATPTTASSCWRHASWRASRPWRHRRRSRKDFRVPSFTYDFPYAIEEASGLRRQRRRLLAASRRDGRPAHDGEGRQRGRCRDRQRHRHHRGRADHERHRRRRLLHPVGRIEARRASTPRAIRRR